ncbi:hypothetical protein GBA52_027907 [Prunus armeniaca]|nr:hypothetical protein GBA52_027907 [Prunus armeniaca]
MLHQLYQQQQCPKTKQPAQCVMSVPTHAMCHHHHRHQHPLSKNARHLLHCLLHHLLLHHRQLSLNAHHHRQLSLNAHHHRDHRCFPPPCDVCGGTPSTSSPPPGADVPSLVPYRPPPPPYVPGNPIAPPVYPTDNLSPPERPYPSKSVHSRMHSSCSTLASIFVLFTSSCFFFFF